jgi:hypothetical protein
VSKSIVKEKNSKFFWPADCYPSAEMPPDDRLDATTKALGDVASTVANEFAAAHDFATYSGVGELVTGGPVNCHTASSL